LLSVVFIGSDVVRELHVNGTNTQREESTCNAANFCSLFIDTSNTITQQVLPKVIWEEPRRKVPQ